MALNDSSSLDKVSNSEKQHNVVLGDYKAQFPDINERNLMRKVDFRVVPAICILYFLAFLDRANIANAAIYGLTADLNLHDTEYNTALIIFMIPYILFEIPSNLLMKRFKPHVWLSACMFCFGAVACFQGTVKNFSGLLAARFFLGVCESNILPGMVYLMSMWYKRSEAQKRVSFLFAFTNLAGAFSGLLASAIGNMNGVGGYKSWRWVFILEGLLTCVISFLLYFGGISDFPEEVKWLNMEEKAFIQRRLFEDVGDSNPDSKVTFKEVFKVLTDYKVILGGLMLFGMIIPGYSYAYFAPTIIQTLGHSPVQTQLYSVAPWIVGFALTMVTAVFSDMLQHRFIFLLISTTISLTGYIILISVHNRPQLQYAALCLSAAGDYAALPIIICWFSNNLGGHLRRSVGTAWQVGFANIGGFIAAFTFIAKDAPRYTKGYSICLGFLCLSLLSSALYLFGIVTENRQRERGDVKGADLLEDEKRLMGDLNPDYRYML